MLRNYFSLTAIFAIFAMAFVSCNTTDNEIELNEPIAVNLRANITPATTRVINDQWQANDQVGLFMVRAGQTLSSASVLSNANNALMTIQGGALISNPPLMYPLGSNVDFIAYYPFHSSVSSNFTIPINVANQSAGLPTEVLFSNNITNQAPTANPVTLNFLYSLAKLELRVTGGANSTLTDTDFANMNVSIEGMYTQANLQLMNGTFTNHSGKQTIALYQTGSNTTSATFQALVLPTNEEITFLFDVGGTVHRHTMTVDYAAATFYRLNFALDFPSFPEATATLLNAVIIPRDENVQDIAVDASCPDTFVVGNTDDWNAALVAIRAGGNGTEDTPIAYTIYVDGVVSVPGVNFSLDNWDNWMSFGSVEHIKVTLIGDGTLSLNSNGSIFAFGNNQTLVIDSEFLTLQGRDNNSNSVVYIWRGGSLVLKNGIIAGNTNNVGNGGGVFVSANGLAAANSSSFTMKGGVISGNVVTSTTFGNGYGGGIAVQGGNFILTGGSINNNTTNRNGGGVCVFGTSTFNMSGGEIVGNTAGSGAGVSIGTGQHLTISTFTMSGGKINNNIANASWAGSGGGVLIASGVLVGDTASDCVFIMTGGEINDNIAALGGGVRVGFHSSFTMKGGTISGNTATRTDGFGGGGVFISENRINRDEFTILDGEISNNTAIRSGGGVYMGGNDDVVFRMEGGVISGNTADDGGGVYVRIDNPDGNTNCNFIMAGGLINGNSANFGGGVSVNFSATFSMEGGIISGNTANNTGGGVHLRDWWFTFTDGIFEVFNSTFTKSGSSIIYGNNAGNSSNTANSGNGHVLYWERRVDNSFNNTSLYRNTTLGSGDNISTNNITVGWGQ